MSSPEPNIVRHVAAGQICCDPEWEAAYQEFETPREEVDKFIARLKRFGLHQAPREMRIVELFCGRGGGLVALQELGFSKLEGVDLSEDLLRQYRGPAQLHLADCRKLPFEDSSCDAAIVHGGLHHLPRLPEDLDAVLRETARVLKPVACFYVVEPWQTPFLRFVHAVVAQPLVRRLYRKGDALATMIDHERDTYEQWLNQPASILELLHNHFETRVESTAWGKLVWRGRPRKAD